MPEIRVVHQGVPFMVNAPEGATEQQAAAFLSRQIEADNSVFFNRAKQLGLNANDLRALNGDTALRPDTSDIGAWGKFSAGVVRGGQKLWNGIQQVAHSPWLLRAAQAQLAGEMGGMGYIVDQNKITPEVEQHLRDAQAAIGEKENEQRRIFEAIDTMPGIMGTTLGLEDLGEIAPTALAMWGTGGTGVLVNAAKATIMAGLEGRTDDESRLEAMAITGVLGTVLPGLTQATTRVLGAAASEMGGRALLSVAGSVAGLRGMGAITNWMQRLGGLARREVRNHSLAEEALHLQQQAAQRMRPIIEGLDPGRVRIAARQHIRQRAREVFQQNLIPEAGEQGGLNVAGFLKEFEGIAESRLRNQLGGKWGREFTAALDEFRVMAPALARISQDPTMRDLAKDGLLRGVLGGTWDFFVGGTLDTLKRTMNPSQTTRMLEGHMWRLMNSAIATIPDPHRQVAARQAAERVFPEQAKAEREAAEQENEQQP